MTKESEAIDAFRQDAADLRAAMEKLIAGGLRKETLVLLLHDHSRVGKTAIKQVLRSIECIETYYFGDPDD